MDFTSELTVLWLKFTNLKLTHKFVHDMLEAYFLSMT